MKQCMRCRRSFEQRADEAFCPDCHAKIQAGNYFEPCSNERPPEGPRSLACLDVEGARVMDYNPRFRGRRRNPLPPGQRPRRKR